MGLEPAAIDFHEPPASTKQPHLDRIRVQLQDVADLLHRESRNLLGAPGGIRAAVTEGAIAVFRKPLHLANLLIAQARLVDQRADLLLPEIVPAFVYRDLVEPCSECRAQVKALQGNIRLQKRLLRHILNVFAPAHYTADNGKQPRLVDAYQLLISELVASLGTPN
jgi:hypothetical protein